MGVSWPMSLVGTSTGTWRSEICSGGVLLTMGLMVLDSKSIRMEKVFGGNETREGSCLVSPLVTSSASSSEVEGPSNHLVLNGG